MSYRVVTESERGNRKYQILRRLGSHVYGLRKLVKDGSDYYNIGIEWLGQEDKVRKEANTFLRGN